MIRKQVLLGGGILAFAILVVAVVPATALADTSEIGRNLGDEVKALATALFLGVAALVAIPVLTRRDVNGGLVIALLVVILGGFVFAQGSVKQVIVELWRAIG
jgi:cobalamin synthase